MMAHVYMAITLDSLELPIAVADTVKELEEVLGLSENTVWRVMSRAKSKGWRCKYIKVDLEED